MENVEGANKMNENDHDKESKEIEQFGALVKKGFEALMPAIRASNSLPKDEQWDLFCTSPSFKPAMDSLGNRALGLITTILQSQGIQRDIRKRDVEEKTELIVEANDKILERVSLYLDELSGIRRNPSDSVADIPTTPVASASGSWNKDVTQSAKWKEVRVPKPTGTTPVVLRNARVTQRPQVKFHDKIDNSSTPFEPRIKDKPNSLKPLAILLESLPGEDECYSHPYEFELDRFQEKIGAMDLNRKKPKKPKDIGETQLITVTEEHQLVEMLEDLRKQREIAVDLEHHSYRSFQGFTCLMQISTRETDYIIDTLELRHKLHILNEVFTHPNIVKVFHSADSDVQWLQRDLCLYVVNMFDTYQAALLLSLPRLSLAYLMKTYCNIDANKHFQLYDWRTRPLAKEAVKYAREDTHYLLYIYDMLWNQLLDKASGGTQLLESALFRSTDTCKKRYWKSVYKEDSHETLYRHSKKNFDNRQMFALKELFAWRDKTAREEDESIGYVLPNHMLLLIAEKLPKEMQGILACCNPIPPLVRQNLVLLHQIILKAREQPLVAKVNTMVTSEARPRPAPQSTVNLEGPLHCPHDLTHNVDFRDDLPTLLNQPQVDINSNIALRQDKPLLPIFSESNEVEDTSSKSRTSLPNQIHFMSPFERYRKMMAYLDNEEKKSKDDKEQEVLQDTRKLLDECMRERLKQRAENYAQQMQSVENLDIKRETSENLNTTSRKRDRSEDNEEIVEVKRVKEETSEKETVETPKLKPYKSLVQNSKPVVNSEDLRNSPPKRKNDSLDLTNNSAKKKKKNRAQGTISLGVNVESKNKETPENKKPAFEAFDYSQVDYNQFKNAQFSQKTPKSHQDKFKHKGKKKQQNKSFTFARQHQGGHGSKKKP